MPETLPLLRVCALLDSLIASKESARSLAATMKRTNRLQPVAVSVRWTNNS